jgi:adenylate cyclase
MRLYQIFKLSGKWPASAGARGAKADQAAADILPTIREIQSFSALPLRQIPAVGYLRQGDEPVLEESSTPRLPKNLRRVSAMRSTSNSRSLDPVVLRFADPKLERRYRDDHIRFRINATRVATLAAAAIWLAFTLLNSLTIRDPSQLLFYVRVMGFVVAIAVCIATLIARPGRWIEPITFAMIAVTIGLTTLLLASMSRLSLPYYPPTEIAMLLGVGSFVAVSFVEGVALAAGTICAFLISVIVLWPEPALLVVFQSAWVVSVVVVAGAGSYLLDRAQHVVWLREMDLLRAEGQVRNLLHNVLPPSIAARKLAGEAPIVDRFSEASLLFADVVGFTSLSQRLDSTQLVGLLGNLFSRFDGIIAEYGLEKIKTIGDCYMAAAGIPEALPGHINRLAQAAIQMLAETSNIRAPDGSNIAIRIGMHAGPVTAGVIGDAKYIFDVWGDTVNTASRMESHGAAGRIQVTDTVYSALAGDYDFEGPQIIDVKGKGPTRVWFLLARASATGR